MSWSAEFIPPVPLPDGGALTDLDQAYLLKLPKAVSDAPAWQNAVEALLLVGESDGPTAFARVGLMQALYPKGEPVYDRTDVRWGKRSLARDR